MPWTWPCTGCAERVGKTVTRAELLRVVWGYKDMPLTRLVDNTIVRLRRKLLAIGSRQRIVNVRGLGYALREDGGVE